LRPPIESVLAIPRQVRSREALERFLEAGEAMVAAGDFDSAGIADIAKAADSSVGTFYRLIGDKDTLLRAVHDRFVEYGRSLIASRMDPKLHVESSLEDVIECFVRMLVDLYSAREGMLRALIVRSSTDTDFRERIHSLRNETRAYLGALVLPRAQHIQHPRPLEAFAFAVKVVLATLNHAAVVASMEGESSDELVQELTQMVVRYLEVA
jgi:AcrR family transcriptional regulator